MVDLFGGFDGFDVASPYGQRKRKRAICEVKAPDPSAAWKLVALRLASAYGELHTLPFGRPQSASPQKSARTSASGPTGKSSPRQSPRHPQNSVTWMRGKQYWSDIFVVVVVFFFQVESTAISKIHRFMVKFHALYQLEVRNFTSDPRQPIKRLRRCRHIEDLSEIMD